MMMMMMLMMMMMVMLMMMMMTTRGRGECGRQAAARPSYGITRASRRDLEINEFSICNRVPSPSHSLHSRSGIFVWAETWRK
jgi:hypothetical protein